MYRFFQYLSVWSIVLALAGFSGRIIENKPLAAIVGGLFGLSGAVISIAMAKGIYGHCDKFASWHWNIRRPEKTPYLHFVIIDFGHYCIYFENEDSYLANKD